MDQYGLTQEETAQQVGKSRPWWPTLCGCCTCAPRCGPWWRTVGSPTAMPEPSCPLPALQEKADAILKSDLSVRQTELLVKKAHRRGKEQPRRYHRRPGGELRRGGRQVPEAPIWAGAARHRQGRKKGRIELEYYGMDDLNNLLDALNGLKLK